MSALANIIETLPPQYPKDLANILGVGFEAIKKEFERLRKNGEITGSWSISHPLDPIHQSAIINVFANRGYIKALELTTPTATVTNTQRQVVAELEAKERQAETERQRQRQLVAELEAKERQAETERQRLKSDFNDKLQENRDLVQQLAIKETLQRQLDSDIATLKDEIETERQRQIELETERQETERQRQIELEAERQRQRQLVAELEDLQRQTATERQKRKRFITVLKSEKVTVIGLIAVIFYQGYHSKHFFESKGEADKYNMVASLFAAVAISLAGLKLTLHTRNKFYIWGVAILDFLIYELPKQWSFSDIIAGLVIALSIVAYSHVLEMSESE